MRKRAIVTLAMGSQYYYRMALALMISARRFGGDRYEYVIFSDRAKLPYYHTPDWLRIIPLGERYFLNAQQGTKRGEGFRIKSMLLSDPFIKTYDALFLDADCYVFRNCFEELFSLIEKQSVAIYGSYSAEGALWGKLDYPGVAAKAGYKVKNMWLNSGFIGRAADELGLLFVQQYERLMKDYPFKPYIQSRFWQSADEPYLATAFQLAYQHMQRELPEQLPSPASSLFITTYDATLGTRNSNKPVVHSNYVKGSFAPAIIHFLGGVDMAYYRKLINRTVNFTLEGNMLRPYFRGRYSYERLKAIYKKLTDRTISETRDV